MTPGKRRRISAEQQQRIVTAYTQGQTVRAVAADEDLSYSTVHRVLERCGVPMRARGGRR